MDYVRLEADKNILHSWNEEQLSIFTDMAGARGWGELKRHKRDQVLKGLCYYIKEIFILLIIFC